MKKIKANTLTGRPSGKDSFVAKVEKMFGRRLRPFSEGGMMRLAAMILLMVSVLLYPCYLFSGENRSEPTKVEIDTIEVRQQLPEGKGTREYYYREVIKEVPKEEEEYIKHLYQELKTPLLKTKNAAVVRRVEGNLIELDKGAIHKIWEGDVYEIYGKNNEYKGKIEVEAIADTVSIASSLKGKNNIEVLDTARYIGQRRFWGSGAIYGIGVGGDDSITEERYQAYGFYWRLLFKNAWGVGINLGMIRRNSDALSFSGRSAFTNTDWGYGDGEIPSGLSDTYSNKYTTVNATRRYYHTVRYDTDFRFWAPVDIRKYFFHPKWYTAYVGIGASVFEGEYNFTATRKYEDFAGGNWNPGGFEQLENIPDTNKKSIAPFATFGGEITLTKYLKFVASGSYFHGPKVEIGGHVDDTRPFIVSVGLIGTW